MSQICDNCPLRVNKWDLTYLTMKQPQRASPHGRQLTTVRCEASIANKATGGGVAEASEANKATFSFKNRKSHKLKSNLWIIAQTNCRIIARAIERAILAVVGPMPLLSVNLYDCKYTCWRFAREMCCNNCFHTLPTCGICRANLELWSWSVYYIYISSSHSVNSPFSPSHLTVLNLLLCRHVEYSGCTSGDVRLADGKQDLEGRVELCQYGVWGAVIADYDWTVEEAMVTCRQLGFPSECELQL